MRITAHAAPSRSAARSILIAALILAGVVVAWFLLPDEPADNPTEPAHVSLAQTRQPDEGGDFLILGMDEAEFAAFRANPPFSRRTVGNTGRRT